MIFILYRSDKAIMELDMMVLPSGNIITDYKYLDEAEVKMVFPEIPKEYDDALSYLNYWLMRRSILWDYKEGERLDSYIHSRLGTEPCKFGRMTEYQGLVSMLEGYIKPDDDISVCPKETQLFWFGNVEPGMNRMFRVCAK